MGGARLRRLLEGRNHVSLAGKNGGLDKVIRAVNSGRDLVRARTPRREPFNMDPDTGDVRLDEETDVAVSESQVE